MREELREAVCAAYSDVAANPRQPHPFPVGRVFAAELGYPPSLLDHIPEPAVDAFTGVSNVSVFAALRAGETVLDLGCGAGLDVLIASRRVGAAGRVYGVDFSLAMLGRARLAAQAAAARNTAFLAAGGECLPFAAGSVAVALVNGIFNLNPARASIFTELARVVRPGGAVFGAELVLREPLDHQSLNPEPRPLSRADWFA